MNNLTPPIAYLLPTGRCNLKCSGCYATLEHAGRHSAEGELSLEEYRQVIAELIAMGVQIFDISGGETMLYPQLVPLCQTIKNYPGTRIWLVTNGTITHPNIMEALTATVERFVVSLDAPLADLHDSMRGHSGAFNLALNSLRHARRLPFPEVAVNQLLMKTNQDTVTAMLELCRTEEVDRLALLSFRDVSENGLMSNMVPDLATLQNCWLNVLNWVCENEFPRYVDLVVPSFLYPETHLIRKRLDPPLRSRVVFHHVHLRGMSAFRESLIVKPRGEITGDTAMANFDEFDIGSARDGVKNIWLRSAPRWRERLLAREEILKQNGPCARCPRWNICRGGCPAAAFHQWGDINRHDRTCDSFRAAGYF